MSYNDYLTNFWGKVPYSGGIHGVKPATEKSTCCTIFHLISRHLSMSPSLILTRLRPTMQLSTETILDYYTAYTSRHLYKSLISGQISAPIVSPDCAPEHEDEHDVRPLDVEEAGSLGAAAKHSPDKC